MPLPIKIYRCKKCGDILAFDVIAKPCPTCGHKTYWHKGCGGVCDDVTGGFRKS